MRGGLKKRYDGLIIFILFPIILLSRLHFNGLVYGLDFGLFQPDGAYYSMFALKLSGLSDVNAAEIVSNWYQTHAYKTQNINVNLLLDSRSQIWAAINPRWIYPVLSVPFVKLLGMWGMLCVPFLSLLLTLVYAQKIFRVYELPRLGLLMVLVISSSPTFLRWMTVNYSDAVLVAIFAILSHQLSKHNLDLNKMRHLILILVFISTQTRFCLPLWLVIALIAFQQKAYFMAILISTTSILFSLPTLFLAPPTAFLPNLTNSNFFEKVLVFPAMVLKAILVESLQLLLLDRILILLIISSFVLSFTYSRSLESRYFFGVFVACLILCGINGVDGVNFRYLMPTIPFMFLSIGHGSREYLR